VTAIYLCALAWASATHSFSVHPFWIWLSSIFVIERIITVRDRGWRHMLTAGLMYELVYDLFLQVVHAHAYVAVLMRRQRSW